MCTRLSSSKFNVNVLQERELQLTNGALDELRGEADSYQRRVRELEEHIQSDDRAEKLEESLKNTQERADELEFRLSKLTQARKVRIGPSFYVLTSRPGT